MGIFSGDGGESNMCILEVGTCIAFEGEHSVPVKCVVVDPSENAPH